MNEEWRNSSMISGFTAKEHEADLRRTSSVLRVYQVERLFYQSGRLCFGLGGKRNGPVPNGTGPEDDKLSETLFGVTAYLGAGQARVERVLPKGLEPFK